MAEEKKTATEDEVDVRLEFMSTFVLKTLRLKHDKWQRMLQGEERSTLNKFLENPNIQMITFHLSYAGVLTPYIGYCPSAKSKVVYFVRSKAEEITKDNVRSNLIIGELANQTVRELAVLTEEIFTPLLCNPKNHQGWPQVVINDVKKHIYSFKNILYQIRGDLNSQVLLPMPAGVERIFQAEKDWISSNGEKMDVYLKTNIEGVVIQWVTQINNALKEDSGTSFKKTPFPLPIDDIKFWNCRLNNLEGIYSQLRDPRVKKMAKYLEMTDSVYLQCFKTILTNLVAAIVEGRDIVLHQKPLIPHFELFENTNFIECRPLIRPMFHCIGLLWGSSQYYCTTDKISVLIQEVCNMMIQKCTIACDPSTMFFGEAIEQVVRIKEVIEILEYFVSVYEMNKAKVESFFPAGTKPVLWSFEFDKVFERFLKYVNRLRMVEGLLQTTVEMLKLEKIEYAGIRGKLLSAKTFKIYEKYTNLYQQISQIQYNPLDTEDESFVNDCNKFMLKVSDIDLRLAKLFGEAFDECANLENMFKLLQIIGDLAYRPRILMELQPRYDNLVTLLENEVNQVHEIYQEGLKMFNLKNRSIIIDAHFPPVAGMLWWIFKLRQRINLPMLEFNQIPFISNEKSLTLQEKYYMIIKELNALEERIFNEWELSVSDVCKNNLSKHLLIKEKTVLKLNFDFELVALLREIRYMILLNKEGIPQEGLDLYYRNEKLQHNIILLNRSIAWYNNIRKGSHRSEVELIEKEMKKIDELFKKGIGEIDWNNEISGYITDVFEIIDKLQQRVLTAQENMKVLFERIKSWSNVPLYDRHKSSNRDVKPQLLALEDNHNRKIKRTADIQSAFVDIEEIIKKNYCLFFNIQNKIIKPIQLKTETTLFDNSEQEHSAGDVGSTHEDMDKLSEDLMASEETSNIIEEPVEIEPTAEELKFREQHWPLYVHYIDSLVKDVILKTVATSLQIFIINMDYMRGPAIPFLKVTVELQEPNLVFKPALDSSLKGGLYNLIEEMIDDIFKQGEIFTRVANNLDKENYLVDATNDTNLKAMENRILENVEITTEDVNKYIQIYEKYSYLWLDDRQEFLKLFLKHQKVLSKEILEEMEYEETEDTCPAERPSLEIFKEQIDLFEKLYEECDKLPEAHLFNGWLQLDMRPLKQALLNLTCKWGNIFKQDLLDHVDKSLNQLEDFIEQTVNSLSIELSENDYDGLLGVMASLIKVRDKTEASINTMFAPLGEIIELLKVYGVDFPEETYDQLEVLPEKWKNLIKLAAVIKHNVTPLQVSQAHHIAKQVISFNSQMQLYRNDFKLKKFFFVDCKDVYTLIDDTHNELINIESVVASLNESCELFGVQLPETKSIMIARKEIKMAKQLWDYYFLVEWTIEDWKKTPWKMIDAESMDMECKRFTKDLRALDKEMRTWETYLAIEAVIKNLLTSLRAVTELQNPAIRDRHWIELMQATKNSEDQQSSTELLNSSHSLRFSRSSSPHLISKSIEAESPRDTPEWHETNNYIDTHFDNETDIMNLKNQIAQKIKQKKNRRIYSLGDFDLDFFEAKEASGHHNNLLLDKAPIHQRNNDFPHIFCEHFN